MTARTPLFATAVALLLVLSAVVPAVVVAQDSGQVVGQPNLSTTTSSGALAPGTTTEVSLAVTNRGQIIRAGPSQHEERVTTARGVVARVTSGNTPIQVNTGSLAIGNVADGTTAAESVSLTIPEGTEPGTYELPVEYEFDYTRAVDYGSGDTEYSDLTVTRESTLEVTVDDRPTFSVVNSTSEALVGQTGQVAVTLENTGSETARDARVTVTSGSGSMTFAPGAESATSYAGRWAPGETKTVTYEAIVGEDADAGTYSADLSVDYTDEQGTDESSRTLRIGVPVGDEQAFALRDVESTLRAGYEGQIRGTLVNEGPNVVRNPVAVLSADGDSFTVTSSEEALPDLEPGEETSVNFTVDVSSSARAARQQFELTVDYDTALGDRRSASPIRPSVQVRPPQDRFAVEAVDGTVEAGEGRTLELRVTNRGEEPLRNVEAKAYLESPLSSTDDEGIIAELEPGETDTIALDVSASSSAIRNKSYPISLDFQYELPDGDTEVSDTYTVPVTVMAPESDGGFPFLLVLGVLVIVIGGIFLYRRRSSANRLR